MARDLSFIARANPRKPIGLPRDAFPPPVRVEVVPIGRADHMRPRDFVLWLEQGGHSRCYPWWIVDNYHMINDVVGGTPIWVAF